MKGRSWLLTTALTAMCFMTGEQLPARNSPERRGLVGCRWSCPFSAGHFQSTNGPIRLWRNGNSSTEFTSGRVQLVYDNVWGNICLDAHFGLTGADVICHQLGYAGASYYDRASNDEWENCKRMYSVRYLHLYSIISMMTDIVSGAALVMVAVYSTICTTRLCVWSHCIG